MAIQQKWKAWLYAFRLRTLPLAFSSIITGSFIAFHRQFNWLIFGLALATTLMLQVLSNLANDFGDSEKGTDNDGRIGPKRAIQAGLLSTNEIKGGIAVAVGLTILSGGALIGMALTDPAAIAFFGVLAVVAILAAITYTVGKHAYGYHGFGDLAVLLFFGFTGVAGSYFMQQQNFDPLVLLPGFTIGAFAVGVLNLNNMRDRSNDEKSGKNTVVVKIGGTYARYYHFALLLSGWCVALFFTVLSFRTSLQFLYVLSAPLFWRHLIAVYRVKEECDYDPLLKQLALSTFFFALLFAGGACC